jgi:hypothetical protein
MIQTHPLLDEIRSGFDDILEVRDKGLESVEGIGYDFCSKYLNPSFICDNIAPQLERVLENVLAISDSAIFAAEFLSEVNTLRLINRLYISQIGLTDYSEEILLDLNHNQYNIGRVCGLGLREEVYDYFNQLDFEEARSNLRAISNQLLADRTAYVDNWKKYHDLSRLCWWGIPTHKPDYKNSQEMFADMDSKE